jgi:hypothetical protein
MTAAPLRGHGRLSGRGLMAIAARPSERACCGEIGVSTALLHTPAPRDWACSCKETLGGHRDGPLPVTASPASQRLLHNR